ncbi:MAG: peptidoglycan D,D-transpeptidase FtsI family protein [Phycisphaerales bacterium]
MTHADEHGTSRPSAAAARATSISRWARVLVSGVALSVVLVAARVVQLKVWPEPQLQAAMVRPNGQLVQQRAAEEPEPRGRIVDRAGRLLAVDTIGGRLFLDVKDLYTDALAAIERDEQRYENAVARAKDKRTAPPAPPVLSFDPIADIAEQIARPMGVEPASIIAPIYARVPQELRTLRRDFDEDDWKRLPRFVVLAEDLTEPQLDALTEARRRAGPTGLLRGAHVQPKSVRMRPFEEMAAALVGKPGFDGNGQSGAELRANKVLKPTAGRTIFFADNRVQVISVPANGHLAGEPGDDVRLSIDMVIQEAVEREINATVDESNAGGGRCIVVDVDTGEILAAYDTVRRNTGRSFLAADPKDKNGIADMKDPALARMRWVSDPFEPGSIFKPFIWAWSIELGKATRRETIRLPDGPLTVSDGRAKRTIREAHRTSYGTKSWEDCLIKSVNAGMATIAFRMTTEEMKQCLSSFRFGMKTGIGLPGETAGILPRADEWTNKTRAQTSVSFGQGIAVTPLQLVQAFTAFCRDGSMVPLSIAPVADGSLTGSLDAIGEPAALMTREVMQDVIVRGTGKKLKDILHFSGFGKSGTAQLVNPQGGYFDDRYVSSFLLGAPFDRPEVAILVTIEDPDKIKTKGAYGGGALAGPCAAKIMNTALEYMGVPTDGELVYAEKKDDAKKLAQADR